MVKLIALNIKVNHVLQRPQQFGEFTILNLTKGSLLLYYFNLFCKIIFISEGILFTFYSKIINLDIHFRVQSCSRIQKLPYFFILLYISGWSLNQKMSQYFLFFCRKTLAKFKCHLIMQL